MEVARVALHFQLPMPPCPLREMTDPHAQPEGCDYEQTFPLVLRAICWLIDPAKNHFTRCKS
jgi:hypothetical protein